MKRFAAWSLVALQMLGIGALLASPILTNERVQLPLQSDGVALHLVYFGYVGCPSVCPTTLSTLAAVLHDLETEGLADDLQVRFVDIGGQVDTQEADAFARRFHPAFKGESVAEMEPLRALEAIGVRLINGQEPMHSTGLYLLEPEGGLWRLRGVYRVYPPAADTLGHWLASALRP